MQKKGAAKKNQKQKKTVSKKYSIEKIPRIQTQYLTNVSQTIKPKIALRHQVGLNWL